MKEMLDDRKDLRVKPEESTEQKIPEQVQAMVQESPQTEHTEDHTTDEENLYEEFGLEQIRELLGKGQYVKLRQEVVEMNDADIADYMEEMEPEQQLMMFRILPKDKAADVFSYMDIENQQYVITSLSDRDAAGIINNLMADDAKDLVEEMPANVVKRLLAHVLVHPEDNTRETLLRLAQEESQ